MYASKILEEVFLWAWIVKDCITTICEMKKLPILKSSTDLTKSIWPNTLYKNHWGYNFGYILECLAMIDSVEWIHTYVLTYTHTYICIAIISVMHDFSLSLQWFPHTKNWTEIVFACTYAKSFS